MTRKLDTTGLNFGDNPQDFEYYPSSIISLNQLLGGQGIRGGLIVQLLADAGHGKTTLALDYVAQAQRKGVKDVPITIGKITRSINALFIDLERTYDATYAATIGVDTSKLLVYKPDFAEQALPQVEALLSQGLQVVVFDSVPAMITKDEFEKDMDDPARMAGSAGVLSRWLIRLVGLVDNAKALMIFINQYRANLSPMARTNKKPFGPYALRYNSGVIIELVRIKTEEELVTIQATVSKSKQGGNGSRCEYIMRQGRGLAPEYDVLSLALEYGIIRKAGAWYEFKGQKAQGLENCLQQFDMTELHRLVLEGRSSNE
jgi:recombination protein RecA